MYYSDILYISNVGYKNILSPCARTDTPILPNVFFLNLYVKGRKTVKRL
jgi:hypothetical protein